MKNIKRNCLGIYFILSVTSFCFSQEVNVAEENDMKIVQVLVDEADIGSVIGKRGNIANAIRTIIQASSYHNKDSKVRINFDAK